MPLASIVITVYKRTTFLRECVQSVLSQKGIDRNDLEIIIVSNTDVSSYDLGADQIIYTEDRGIGKKILLGINASHSKILFFLEDDDYFLPNKIKTILPFFTDATVGYVHNCNEAANDGKVFKKTVERIDPSWLDHQSFIRFSKRFWHYAGNMSSITVRNDSLDREVIEHIRLLPDVVIFPSILMKGMNCIQVNEPLTFYRKHDANTTSSLYREDLAEFTLEEGQFWLEYVGGKSINLEKQARRSS